MGLMDAARAFVRSIVEMPGMFREVALQSPMTALLLAFGTLFVGVAVAALGYLALGAALSLFTVERSPQPPREAR